MRLIGILNAKHSSVSKKNKITAFFCHRSQCRFNVVYFFLTCGNYAFTEYIDSYDFKLSKKKKKKKS